MKKSLSAFYRYTDKMQKYTNNKKDYYLRCLVSFFVRYTYLKPDELYVELLKQFDESKNYNQTFTIDGEEYWIMLDEELTNPD